MKHSKSSRSRVKAPTTLQMEALECGAASLSMVLAYYKKYVSLEVLRIECGVSRDGTKASNILKAARKFGLDGSGFRMEIEGLNEIEKPAILFWNFNHFVVYEGRRGKKFVINDPAVGRRYIDPDEFSDSFTGVVLTFKPSENFVADGAKPSIIGKIKRRLVGLKPVFAFMSFLSILLFIPGFIFPTFSRFFVDNILVKDERNLIRPLVTLMAITAIVNMVLSIVRKNALIRFQIKIGMLSSSKFVMRLLKMPAQFFTQRLAGELCNRIVSCDNISTLISNQLITIVVNLISTIFFLVLMFTYDIPLSIITVSLTIVTVVIFAITSERIRNKSFKIQMESGKLSGLTMSGISMVESIKASGSENDFFMQWSGQQAKVIQESQRMAITDTGNSIAPGVISSVQSILILTIGAMRVMDGHLTIGMLLAFQTLLSNFASPINSFMGLGKALLSANADMQRIDDVMDYPVPKIFKDQVEEREDEDSGEYKPIKKLEGYVSLKDIVFGYSPLSAPLLNGFNLDLTPGKRVALVGATGSGKSTIGRLVSTLYSPWSGEILFDGIPLNQIDKNVFAASISVVDQTIFLFEGSVKENLTMFNSTIPEEVYIQAAKDACIHEVIASRPEGYYSKVEEGGRNFSGGQRQRLEIARALTTNPRILIMDEATSSLDAITEQTVAQNIRRRGCTSIIIAHRLSTIRDCDEIIVLDNGNVVQRGTHEELIAVDGNYKELVKTM